MEEWKIIRHTSGSWNITVNNLNKGEGHYLKVEVVNFVRNICEKPPFIFFFQMKDILWSVFHLDIETIYPSKCLLFYMFKFISTSEA